MTRKRFILLLLFILTMAAFGIGFGGNSFILYLDVPSFILVPIMPYLIASFIYPFREQKKFNREIFIKDGSGDRKKLKNAVAFYSLLKRLTIISTLFTTLIEFIGIMGELSAIKLPDTFGAYFGVLSITIFYATIFILAIVEPLKGAAEKKLNS